MINDVLRDTDPPVSLEESDAVAKGEVRYKAVYDALDDVTEPYALLILADGGLHCIDNSEDVGVEKLARIFVNFASVVGEVVSESLGEAALDTLLIDTVMSAKGTD